MLWRARNYVAQRLHLGLVLFPLLTTVGAFFANRGLAGLDHWLRPRLFDFSESTAVALLAAVISAVIGLLGIMLAFLTLVLQSAMAQLTARALPLLQDDDWLKLTLSLLVGTFTYCCLVLAKLRPGWVPQASVAVGGLLALFSVIMFLGYLQHVLQELRPAAVAERIVRAGVRATRRVHAGVGAEVGEGELEALLAGGGSEGRPVHYRSRGSCVQAIDRAGLLRAAVRGGGTIILSVAVGDYVYPGSSVAQLVGPEGAVDERQVAARLATGVERQMVSTPEFALRLLVDMALRALSEDMNDPTTAVQILDRIEYLLLELAGRPLGPSVLRDASGTPRVVVPSPSWEEYVQLALTEIRLYGERAVQMHRRMRALLRRLMDEVPAQRVAALRAQLELLNGELEAAQEQARFDGRADVQGIGPERFGLFRPAES